MASITTTQTWQQLDMRKINREIQDIFKRYSMSLVSIHGGDGVFKDGMQTRQMQDASQVPVEYAKGNMVVSGGIDPLEFMLTHTDMVAKAIGLGENGGQRIWKDRRNAGKVQEYLDKLYSRFALGEGAFSNTQLHISMRDGNTASLSSIHDWQDCVMYREWVDSISELAGMEVFNPSSQMDMNGVDYRVERLADIVQGMMADHIVDFHSRIEDVDATRYLDSGSKGRYEDAFNRLNSLGRLEYGFYEMFKPVGETPGRYIKVCLDTDGRMDITGVVGLSDCNHIEWEYGSKEYLRSLNTGNQRYGFNLSMPFNTKDSMMWWKPDEPEPLDDDGSEEEETETSQRSMAGKSRSSIPRQADSSDTELDSSDSQIDSSSSEIDSSGSDIEGRAMRYYKPYETERFLRWFGSTYIPLFDLERGMSRKTLCSAPILPSDLEVGSLMADATNLLSYNAEYARQNIDETTSISLLSLAQKATIDVENREDGQYLMFVVSGHQQTYALSFHVSGWMYGGIQEPGHYLNTWASLVHGPFVALGSLILFMEVSQHIDSAGTMEKVWNILHPDESLIPQDWLNIYGILGRYQDAPTAIDLLRFRQMDMESLMERIDKEGEEREAFLRLIDKNPGTTRMNLKNAGVDGAKIDAILALSSKSRGYFSKPLHGYIMNFTNPNIDESEMRMLYEDIDLPPTQKENMVKKPLSEICKDRTWVDGMAFNLGVSEMKDRIQTLNNLIVRLPINTYHNKLASRHIFQDWKVFVDRNLENLCLGGYLFRKDGLYGVGTDGKTHGYSEYYTDSEMTKPFIDYSYCFDKDGKVIHDRWDYWTVEDFE